MDGGVAVKKILAPIDRSKYKEKIAYAEEYRVVELKKKNSREKQKQKHRLKIYSTQLICRQRKKELI